MTFIDQPTLFDLHPAPLPQAASNAPTASSTPEPAIRACLPRRPKKNSPARVRFAFYGRVSTTEYQDPASSKGWQTESALDLIADSGHITVEYFDIGCSRRLSWTDRPQASRLLHAIAHPDRDFDAIVVGESERAFCAGQLPALIPYFTEHNVQVWLPELNGPLDTDDPIHQAAVLHLGAQARREVVRARFRTTQAMRAQTRDQGRYLGGRPPYGYRLTDAGPHPNRAHARWGRRLHRLDPDPRTAPTVTRIFTDRLAGHSISAITRALNTENIPCPSAVDPERNPHRSGLTWTETCVISILANPRYTGYQVWNRQSSRHLPSPQQASTPQIGPSEAGRRRVHQWNDPDDWAISNQPAHPPLISHNDFLAVQNVHTSRADDTIPRRHTYLLAGLLRCTLCGRRMDSHWANDRPGYRCRHGHRSSQPDPSPRPRTLYLREDELLTRLLRSALLPQRIDDPRQLANYLYDHQLTIDCGPTAAKITPGDPAP